MSMLFLVVAPASVSVNARLVPLSTLLAGVMSPRYTSTSAVASVAFVVIWIEK